MSELYTFDFPTLKKFVCQYAQTLDYKAGWDKVKLDYLETFDEYIPYPIQDYPEDYTVLINWLSEQCEENSLAEVKYITQSELFGLGWTPKLTEQFGLYPEVVKRRQTGYGYYNLYNYNRAIELMETDEFQHALTVKKSKKAKYL